VSNEEDMHLPPLSISDALIMKCEPAGCNVEDAASLWAPTSHLAGFRGRRDGKDLQSLSQEGCPDGTYPYWQKEICRHQDHRECQISAARQFSG